MHPKRGQIGSEYLLLVGFLTFVIVSFFALAYSLSNRTQESIRFSQIESFQDKVISNAEMVFYSGEPSKTEVEAYLPEGVESIDIIDNQLLFKIQTSSGTASNSYISKVPIYGNISSISGQKRIQIIAESDKVYING